MLERVLRAVLPDEYPLVLVRDPDRVLADEGVAAALADRGCRVVDEPDPVRLRVRVEQVRPWTTGRPLLVRTDGALEALPYDLWQQGRRVDLALHEFFANLAYPLLRDLSPRQRARLANVPSPEQPLAREGTALYLLQHVFHADPLMLNEPARLISWLDAYHAARDPMSATLAAALERRLEGLPALAGLNVRRLLSDPDAFVAFVREQWGACVGQQTGRPVPESPAEYRLRFESDPMLQDTVVPLVRSGTIFPVAVASPDQVAPWVRPGVIAEGEDRATRRRAALKDALTELLSGPANRWEDWQSIARAWAELTAHQGGAERPAEAPETPGWDRVQQAIRARFPEWLRKWYAPLGALRLPVPHHVFHVPHVISHRQRLSTGGRALLLVMDGMSLSDWLPIRDAWRARHPAWRVSDELVLAQVPTITSISRQALVGGVRPADLSSLADNRAEASLWERFWSGDGVPPHACAYSAMGNEPGLPPEAHGLLVRAVCLVNNELDELAHSSTQGEAGVRASLAVWLANRSPAIEATVAEAIDSGFTVFVASDHGHVEACGMGTPAEGILVQTRSKRARLYTDRLLAARTQQRFPDTIRWEADGLLPDGVCALMPKDLAAFAPFDEVQVTHGGASLEEVVVPLVTIAQG